MSGTPTTSIPGRSPGAGDDFRFRSNFGLLKLVWDRDSVTGEIRSGTLYNEQDEVVGGVDLAGEGKDKSMRVRFQHTLKDKNPDDMTITRVYSLLPQPEPEPPRVLTLPKEAPGGCGMSPKLSWQAQQRQNRGRWHR